MQQADPARRLLNIIQGEHWYASRVIELRKRSRRGIPRSESNISPRSIRRINPRASVADSGPALIQCEILLSGVE